MLKIGDFSKLSHLTVKALRFYEKEGLLLPAYIDECTGYRFYETKQLVAAAKVKSYRQLGFSIEEIRQIFLAKDPKLILKTKSEELEKLRENIDIQLSIINNILEDEEMKYQVIEKNVEKTLVYYSETILKDYSDLMQWVPSVGEECLRLNPDLKCAEPPYEFCEYLDCEYKENNIKVRHNEAVKSLGVENEIIKFKELPETKVLSIFHKGAYSSLNEAYAFIFNYAKQNGYKVNGYVRECYIDGIWNKDSEEEWLTEIQLPIE